jgi:hypothetical protein
MMECDRATKPTLVTLNTIYLSFIQGAVAAANNQKHVEAK